MPVYRTALHPTARLARPVPKTARAAGEGVGLSGDLSAWDIPRLKAILFVLLSEHARVLHFCFEEHH